MADDVRRLAEREGLTAHAASVDVRLGTDEAVREIRLAATIASGGVVP